MKCKGQQLRNDRGLLWTDRRLPSAMPREAGLNIQGAAPIQLLFLTGNAKQSKWFSTP